MVSTADILNAPILIVDDKDANVRLLGGMLRIAGYSNVHSTTNPAEVSALYLANRYGLILLDLQMPGLDGFQVMEILKKIEPDGYLPVLILTAQPASKLRALQAGARDFLSKPFDQAELNVRVRNMIEVRLLHIESRDYSLALEASQEVIRLKTLAEQKRNAQEMSLAQETQQSLLPQSLPVIANFVIHAFNSPTRYVGGDFYDFLELNCREWTGVLADVSGKGIHAALLSSMVLGALSIELRSGTRPSRAVTRVNRLLCEKSLCSQFVSLFLFLLDAGGKGQFISAGHNPAWLFRAATCEIETLTAGAPVLGVMPDARYRPRPFHLSPGDLLVVYSDGLTDAEDTQGKMFGETRLREIVQREARAGGRAVEQAILKTIADFTCGVAQTDDITFLIIEHSLQNSQTN